MDSNLDPYVFFISDEDITFKGDTPQEQELNKWLYHTTLELNRYQDMTQQVLNYILAHQKSNEAQDIYSIIKEWCC